MRKPRNPSGLLAPPPLPGPLETLRRIRRDTWSLLAQLADLAPGEREHFRHGLEAIRVGMERGLELVDEAVVEEGA